MFTYDFSTRKLSRHFTLLSLLVYDSSNFNTDLPSMEPGTLALAMSMNVGAKSIFNTISFILVWKKKDGNT